MNSEQPEPSEQDEIKPSSPVRKRGVAAAMLAGGLVAIENLLGRKPRQDAAEIRESAGEPGDIYKDGITVALDESTTVHSPPPSKRSSETTRIVQKRLR